MPVSIKPSSVGFVETDDALQVAAIRSASNRAAGRVDVKRDPNRLGTQADLTGAAAELWFAKWAGIRISALFDAWGKPDDGWDFDVPNIGKIDVKGTNGKNRSLIYLKSKWPPKVVPDWLVLCWTVPLGSETEVSIVGCIEGQAFDKVKVAHHKMAWNWSARMEDLKPIEALGIRTSGS